MSDITSSKAPRPVGLYPHARRVGNLLFLSGLGPRDPATNEVVGTFEVGMRPEYLAVHDGRVWVANSAGQSVSVLDAATGEKVADIGFDTGVHGIAAADGSIWVLDLHGPRVLDNLKGATIWRLDPERLAP